jgi:hypothetical protein
VAAHPHLTITREQPVNERRRRRAPGVKKPIDPEQYAAMLYKSLTQAIATDTDIPGFDSRLLFKLQVDTSIRPEDIEQGIPGVEVVSQEDGGYALVFADQQAIETFESRLTSMEHGEQPTYANVLYALKTFDHWTEEDRKGWALKKDGFPSREEFLIDIELWPVALAPEREQLVNAFRQWLREQSITETDKIIRDSLIAFRVRTTQLQASLLLRHRDVRLVDLPPKLMLEPSLLQLDIQTIQPVPPPPENAPKIAVLDSGIAEGHPLIKPALGDAQGFVDPDRDSHDDNGHGTLVAGIALYDDVETCAQSGQYVPRLHLLSGRILDEHAEADTKFVENSIEEAVRYFYDNYKCRIFNLSYGDMNKPYTGGRVRGLAYILDRLSRELDILFVVPTGNFPLVYFPDNAREQYPDYLLNGQSGILDPAPALNVLTVGSIARYDQTYYARRYGHDIKDLPISRRNQLSPFSRCGGSVKGAIKPELVDYGGNVAFDLRTKRHLVNGLGELSTNKSFSEGRVLGEQIGTSFAVPHVTHLAARILEFHPAASSSLIRALLVSHANCPAECAELFENAEKLLSKTVGYGKVEDSCLYRSTEENVSLIAETAIANDTNHFYEIPLCESLFSKGKRRREITVTLAYTPAVRTTRVDYKGSKMQFRFVEAATLEEVVQAADHLTINDIDSLRELTTSRSCFNSTIRSLGTVQSSTWVFKQPRSKRMFIVVTRNDQSWAESITKQAEPYALVVRISDRENQNAQLYSQIQAIIQERVRTRARVRT